MECINWVIASGKEDAATGLARWDAGTSVDFWWFDGRHYKDNAASDLTGDANVLWIDSANTPADGSG